ncbi:hypothetical protein [Nostoc sp.]|uniref:hypothetical protein n=1 Tax=Nostoc sp. TaxID=1180 RepID=UPI002FFBF6D8
MAWKIGWARSHNGNASNISKTVVLKLVAPLMNVPNAALKAKKVPVEKVPLSNCDCCSKCVANPKITAGVSAERRLLITTRLSSILWAFNCQAQLVLILDLLQKSLKKIWFGGDEARNCRDQQSD